MSKANPKKMVCFRLPPRILVEAQIVAKKMKCTVTEVFEVSLAEFIMKTKDK